MLFRFEIAFFFRGAAGSRRSGFADSESGAYLDCEFWLFLEASRGPDQ